MVEKTTRLYSLVKLNYDTDKIERTDTSYSCKNMAGGIQGSKWEGGEGRGGGVKERKKRASTSSFFLPKPLKLWEDGSQGTDWYSRAIKCRMACQATDRSPGLIERIFHSDEFLSSLSDEFLAGVEAKIPLPPFSTSKGMVYHLTRFSFLFATGGRARGREGRGRNELAKTAFAILRFSCLIIIKKKKNKSTEIHPCDSYDRF